MLPLHYRNAILNTKISEFFSAKPITKLYKNQYLQVGTNSNQSIKSFQRINNGVYFITYYRPNNLRRMVIKLTGGKNRRTSYL